jgi:hypothetical protein
MPNVSSQDLQALASMIQQANIIASSDPLPTGGIERLRELLSTADQLASLLARDPDDKMRSYRRSQGR